MAVRELQDGAGLHDQHAPAFELVPLELMKDNPDGLDLATPSIALKVDDLEAAAP